MLDITATIEIQRGESLKVGDVEIKFTDDIQPQLRFLIEPSTLAKALNLDESKTLVNELCAQHGNGIFADVADDVIQEFAE